MTDICTGKLEYHTYDAMWCQLKDDRVEVPNIRNDGSHTHEESNMTDSPYNKPLQTEKFNEVFEGVKSKAQDAVQNEKAQSVLSENKELLITAGLLFVAYKLNKRMIKNVVRKDSLIIKTHLMNVTKGLEDLAELLGARPTEAWNSAVRDLK